MKKFIASTIVVLLLAQSLTPATYASVSTDPATTTKLSSGKRVNTAADDAAGLSTTTEEQIKEARAGYGDSATTATPEEKTTKSTTTTNTSSDTFVDRYKTIDLGSLKTFEVLQTAIVGYASQIGGNDIFGDEKQYADLVNQFLNKYAPNFGFKVGDAVPEEYKGDENTYYQNLTDRWSKKNPKEYDEVYLYAKNRQSSSTNVAREAKETATPVAATATATTACTLSKENEKEIFGYKIEYESLIKEGKLTEASEVFKKIESIASKCSGTNSSVVQFAQDCSIAYTRYMAEYNNLIAKNAPMAEITKIKQLISDAEKGTNCVATLKTEQTLEKHKSLVQKVKEALDFGSTNTDSVIPQNVVPSYCEANVVNGLYEQLDANSYDKITDIKSKIGTILENQDIKLNQNKKSILQFALNTATTVSTTKLLEENIEKKESLAMDNFARNLALVADALVTGRGVTTVLKFLEDNFGNVESMLNALNQIDGFDSFESVLRKGGDAYERNGQTFVQKKDAIDQDDLTFAFPSSKNATTNDAVVTLRSVQTKTYDQESDRGYYDTKISLDKYDLKTAAGFAQAARDNGTFWTMGVPAVTLSKDLYNALNPNGTWYNEVDGEKYEYVNFYIGMLGDETRAYQNYNGDVYMPAGSYETYWSRYEIANDGTFVEVYINEVPVRFAAKVEVSDRIIAAAEANLEWASTEQLVSSKSIFPKSISATVYIADFLFELNVKREKLSGSDWELSVNADIKGPSICKFNISGSLKYKNGSEADIEIKPEDFVSANLELIFNSDTIAFEVEDLDGLITDIQELDARGDSKDGDTEGQSVSVQDYVDTINSYIDAAYSFAGQKLAEFVADTEQYVVVEYPDESREAVIDLGMKYAGLVNIDYLMEVLGPLLGGGESPKEDNPTPVYDYSKFYSNVSNDGSSVYANYSYTNQDATSTYAVSPDQVSMYIFTKGEGCEASYCVQSQTYPAYDGSNYIFDYTSVASDPTVVAAYVYASYTEPKTGKTFEDTYYIIGSYDVINPSTPTPALDCTDPKNMSIPECMMPSAPTVGCTDSTALNYDSKAAQDDGTCKYTPSITMDVAGYSLISAQNTEQFMIGFKLSSAPTDLTAPDSVMLTLYYADSTKASSSLSQDVDGYYVGSNSFAYDDNITSAVVTAYSTIDGQSVNAQFSLK